jgi:hypothetical protein
VTGGEQISVSELQRYFSGLGTAPSESVDLAAALQSAEAVAAATAGAHAPRLAPHLPPAPPHGTQDDVRTTLLSPQFAQVNPHVLRTCFLPRLAAPSRGCLHYAPSRFTPCMIWLPFLFVCTALVFVSGECVVSETIRLGHFKILFLTVTGF